MFLGNSTNSSYCTHVGAPPAVPPLSPFLCPTKHGPWSSHRAGQRPPGQQSRLLSISGVMQRGPESGMGAPRPAPGPCRRGRAPEGAAPTWALPALQF